tara:strand:+ start:56 stop:991 length:936 start_codon:yes stop_codon:yes gene_type:complete
MSQVGKLKKFKQLIIMKKVLIIALCFLATGLHAQTKTLKVISYNIWNGFDFRKDLERKNDVIEWLADQKPDVVALQELCGYNEESLLEDAQKWGHNYVIILKDKCHSVGLTSVNPVVLKERVIEDLWHGMLHCETFGIDFFVVHLSPKDRNFRVKESKIIISKINSIKNKSFMVLGDFNSHSPFDADTDLDNPDILKNVRVSDLNNKKYNNLIGNEFDYSVMASFIANPLIDVTQRFVKTDERFTYPAKANLGAYKSNVELDKNRRRIDFIMVSPEMAKKCKNSSVYNDEETALFSDHYPVMAEFELNLRL